MQQKAATISSAKIAAVVGDDGAAIQQLFGSVVAAFAAGKPVLTTVSAKHRDAWRALAPETTFLSANDATIMMWWQSLRTT